MKQSNVIVIRLAAFLLAFLSIMASAAADSGTFRVAQGSAGAGSRVALVVGNATYPDDDKPLAQPTKDVKAIAEELRRADFDVITGEDVSKQKLRALLGSFKAKIKQGSTALVFFSGYGIQSGKQSYIIPVDAQIWTEGEVKRDGISIESILADMNAAGATVKLVIIDAARRNPFERRFRGLSIGLAPLTAPAGTLAIYSAAPDRVVNDSEGANSLFVTELLKEMRTPGLSAEAIFNSTQKGVSRASKSEQVPWVSSSLVEEFHFGKPSPSSPSPPSASSPAAPPPPPSSIRLGFAADTPASSSANPGSAGRSSVRVNSAASRSDGLGSAAAGVARPKPAALALGPGRPDRLGTQRRDRAEPAGPGPLLQARSALRRTTQLRARDGGFRPGDPAQSERHRGAEQSLFHPRGARRARRRAVRLQRGHKAAPEIRGCARQPRLDASEARPV